MNRQEVTIIIGAQWGDEGKGKWVDKLSENATHIVRFQGGNNAGHTIYIGNQKIVLHQIPSGILRPRQICVVSAGVVLNPVALTDEIQKLASFGVDPERLWLSAKAHVITPWHIYLDGQFEQNVRMIGTTKRGIGPTYADKASRSGLRLVHYVDPHARELWIRQMSEAHLEFKNCLKDQRELWEKFNSAANQVKPFVTNAETRLRHAIKDGASVLLEGAQGTLLDLNYGTYPYVTSSSTIAGGALANIGLPPKAITKVVGIAKAYLTRVGEGPMPTELFDDTGKLIAQRGQEFGASTGRPRRVGWFDAVAMRYSQDINGFDHVIINKMDILEGLPELKIATKYRHPTLGLISDFPDDTEVLQQCEPVYETLPGFKTIPKSGKRSDLPPTAQGYLSALEHYSGIKIEMIGTGVERQDAIFLD